MVDAWCLQEPANKVQKPTLVGSDGQQVDAALFWETAPPTTFTQAAGQVRLDPVPGDLPEPCPSPALVPNLHGAAAVPQFKYTPAVGTKEDSLMIASSEGADNDTTFRVRHHLQLRDLYIQHLIIMSYTA